jgi:mono/diheme cytochrome c family protein
MSSISHVLVRAHARPLALAALGVFAALSAYSAQAQRAATASPNTSPDGAPRGSIDRGRALYVDLRCNSCHGTVGQGSGFTNAGPKILPDLFPWDAFIQQLRRPRLDMPAYIPQWVSDQDIADMYSYLVMLRDRPPARSAPRAPLTRPDSPPSRVTPPR